LTGKDARRPSAYKHGAFSKTVLFPWEDANEFEALHRSLNHELNPLGALEEEAVYTILTCIWRKRRIRDKRDLDTLAALQEKDLAVLSEEPLPFFDTAHEATIYDLTHRSKSDRRPRDHNPRDYNKVSQLIGFSSSLYGMLDVDFLDVMIGMLAKSSQRI
jgi:hypothetical protein